MSNPTTNPAPAAFPATRWSVVVRAGSSASPDAHAALASLCQDYWRPLYAFARRKGHGPEEAKDLTQGFIASILETNSIARAEPSRGRFRTFLLAAFCHFLAKDHREQMAQKRAGAAVFVDVYSVEAEPSFQAGLQHDLTPEREFDRRWALSLLEMVMCRLQDEYFKAGRSALFEAIQPHLSGAGGRPGYAQLGVALGLSESAVTVAAHRMRKRYGQLLREAIASTVDSSADADGELQHLIAILSETH